MFKVFIIQTIGLVILTLIIGSITYLERKVLALIQRRKGPLYVGYKGRLQFMADAVKLLSKNLNIVIRINKIFFFFLLTVILIINYIIWVNILWGANLNIINIEYNLIILLFFSLILTIFIFIVGWVSKNKYAILSIFRSIVISICLEIFLNFLILYFLLCFESFSFYQIVFFQNFYFPSIIIFLPLLPFLIILFLLEVGRIPFDLSEAEAELISGYTVEMGGFFFALFYLGEYFHLFCLSFIYVLCFFSGWNF